MTTKRIRDGFKRNFKMSTTGLSVSLAINIKDEGEGKAEDDSQGFLFIIMKRWRHTEVAQVLWGKWVCVSILTSNCLGTGEDVWKLAK